MIGRARVSGHFGEWLQGRLGPEGPVVLVTLPCHLVGVSVESHPASDFEIASNVLSETAGRALLQRLGVRPPKFRFTVTADVEPGGGAGMSTAALIALAEALGVNSAPGELAKACLAVEGAVDPLMLPAPDEVLWASREAQSLRSLPPPPIYEIVGGFWGAPQRTDPGDGRFADVSDLVSGLDQAVKDRRAFAALVTDSAERTSALRGPEADPTADMARELGALGHVRAHTGSARALLFAPGQVPEHCTSCMADAGISTVMQFSNGDST